ncbi:hypothetical protein MRX96_006509 [Rhipicephalus microplus]
MKATFAGVEPEQMHEFTSIPNDCRATVHEQRGAEKGRAAVLGQKRASAARSRKSARSTLTFCSDVKKREQMDGFAEEAVVARSRNSAECGSKGKDCAESRRRVFGKFGSKRARASFPRPR